MQNEEIIEKDDGLGDWRIRAVTTLAKDLPATASGARVSLMTSTRAPDGQSVGFTTPSAAAMALNLVGRAIEESQALKEMFVFHDVVTAKGRGKAIRQERELFDYFEHCMVITTFSFQALEAFCNQTVADDMKAPVQLERRRDGKKQLITLNSPADVERTASTEEKLTTVVPAVLDMASPRGKAVWGPFVALNRARDATIHLKSLDQYPSRKEQGFEDDASLFYQFLYQDMT